MLHTVAEFDDFERDAYAAGMSDDEIIDLADQLAADPRLGDLMVGTGGARKFRVSGRGRGKRGGYRVVTYFAGDDLPVFLVTVFAKGDRDNLSKAERNELRKELAGVAEAYRNSRAARIVQLRRRTP
jgi:hypothetical protein